MLMLCQAIYYHCNSSQSFHHLRAWTSNINPYEMLSAGRIIHCATIHLHTSFFQQAFGQLVS